MDDGSDGALEDGTYNISDSYDQHVDEEAEPEIEAVNEQQEDDEEEEEEGEPVTFSEIWGNAVEEEDHPRVSSNSPSGTSFQPILYEEQLEQQQQKRQRIAAEEEPDQTSREDGESRGNGGDGVCCSICMEPWSSQGNHQVSCLPCGHVYGLSCIKKWIRRSIYSKCPQCDRQCRLEDIIMLYVPRLVVVDGEQQKKILSLKAENDFLKMESKGVRKKITKMNRILEENKRLAWEMDGKKEKIRRIAEVTYKGQDEKKEEIMRLLFSQPSPSHSPMEDGTYNISDDDEHVDEEAEPEIDEEEEEEEEEDHPSNPIPFTSTIRVSSNSPSGTSAQPILYEEQLEQQQQQLPQQRIAEEEHDQRGRENGESSGNGADGICCSICMEPWSSQGNHQVSCLPCGHVHGLSCIKKWIRRSTYSKCPQCNRQCRLKDIITLYVPRPTVVDEEQQKKILSLQAENDFLKMKSKGEWKEITSQMNRVHYKTKSLSWETERIRKVLRRIVEEIYKGPDEQKKEVMRLLFKEQKKELFKEPSPSHSPSPPQ